MEDVTNLPFRLLTKRLARPGLMFTEFVSAMAHHYNPERALRKMRVHSEEEPLAVQIFGGDPETMAEAARSAEASGAAIVDINMGCWVPKVCRTGAGAALLKDPDLAERIVSAVVQAVQVPVTVKVRAGWDYSLFAAPELARRFEAVGAQMLTLHARFAKQGFEGHANWRLIADIREAIRIPLVGNGDVKTPEDAWRMLDETGCDGVMVGRAAIANPWALRDIVRSVSGREPAEPPTIDERINTALNHAESTVRDFAETGAGNELRALSSLRSILPLYLKGFPGASEARSRLSRVSSLAELHDVLEGYRHTEGAVMAGVH